MKILMVVNNFVPEIGSAAHIYFDLAKAFIKRGHEIDVITSFPRKFNLVEVDQDKTFPLDEEIEGIRIHRCKHISLRNNLFLRGCEHFLCPIYYLIKYVSYLKKFDICLMYIPPLPLYYLARIIKILDGTPSILNYQDFHPQELTDVGLLKNPLLIKIMEYIEHQSYKNVDFITVLSRGGINYIAERGGVPSKIQHIYNGSIVHEDNEQCTNQDFKMKMGIEDKILITYAGILSPFQGLDVILNAAKELREHNELVFYLVGDGMMKDHLAFRIKKEDISNIKLLPLQTRKEYNNIVNSSDIALVSLDHRMKAPCIPGKLINLMALKRPILAIASQECETSSLINSAKCGMVVEPNNEYELIKAILRLEKKPLLRRQLGLNGKDYLDQNMNLEKSVYSYERIMNKLVYGKDD